MLRPGEIVVDQYSPLSHKNLVGDPDGRAVLNVAPTWVPDRERRRLAAYLTRAAYLGNVARLLLPADTGPDAYNRDGHREYGDPAVLVDRVVAGVLGTEWLIVVDGADDDLLDGPQLPDRPDEPATTGDRDVDALNQRIHAAATAAWAATAGAVVDDWEQALAAQPTARARQAELRAWSDTAQFPARMIEAEHDAVGLGDSIYVLWPTVAGWPTVQVMDPGFYFPELDDDSHAGYPTRVHLAWEFDETDATGVTSRFVRRITFELADLTLERLTVDGRGNPVWTGADGQPLVDGTNMVLPKGDRFQGGLIRRTLPWHQDGDPPVTTTCLLSDGVWPLDAVQAGKVDALDETAAQWRVRRRDLGVDFLPVVHVPNTPTGKDHYGRSTLDQVAQVLDDIATVDTRIADGAQYLGEPAIALAGAKTDGDMVLAPGRVYGLGEKGSMTPLDLSAGIDKLLTVAEGMADRLYRNIGVPGEMMGRADTGDIAGITLLLRFAPFAQLIGVLRTAREPKMRLVPKFAQRLAQVAGVLEPGPTPVARIQYGNFLPTNRKETVQLVAEALVAHAMSTQTAVAMLVAAGVPVDDAAAEVQRIRYENPAAAAELANAMGAEAPAADWLGLDPTAPPSPPTIVLPGAGGGA